MAGPLWVDEIGSGRPLALLHGNGESHRVFDAMAPFLAPHHRLVGIDSTGHGGSPRGEGPLTIARNADHLDTALGALGLAGIDLLGFSDGGNVALELALRHPGRLGRLIVVGANLFPAGMRAGTLRRTRVMHTALRGLGPLLPAARATAERFALMTDDPHIDPAALAQVEIPVLVVAGEKDLVRDEHTRLIADCLPAARLVIVEDAGHMLPRSHPKLLATLVEEFLGGG